uniref:NADH-ubiquinone oxidoreductase chain 3 n=1 Tax=Neocyema erythrosoma TaxID=2024705 RepID=A0A347ZJT4_9TELE|nr:NADH dehydrogenase subunit 3 [Neocyema erythrosoma]BBA85499.1 NADH dehydrogenase subunit 3 [Neocyema erythrosoma]
MNLMMSTLIVTGSLAYLLIVISFWLPQMSPNAIKLSPYECGFDPTGSARIPFSIRFFLVGVLFLLFDLEIALLLPITWGGQLSDTLAMFSWVISIIIIMTLGLTYEWVQGGLEWAE